MRRDVEEVCVYCGKKTVWDVFTEDVPKGSINPATGHNIFTKIVRRGKVICKDYGALKGDDNRFDELIVKKMIRYPDEIRIFV